jgi:hypothetical protein
LPTSFAEIARSAAERLAADHTHRGGGTLVTACAPSLTQLRRVGVDALDLMTLLGRGLADG